MESLMLECHPQYPAQSPRQNFSAIVNLVVQSEKPGSDSIPEIENLAQDRPFFVLFGNSGVVVNLGRIFHMRVDTAFKDVLEMLWFRMLSLQGPGKMDVEEGRDMTQVEETLVSEVDRFLVQHALWDHIQRD